METRQAAAVELQQYLTFRLGEETFGIDVLQVREILDLVPVTHVPQTPEWMLGVINLRGGVVPVIDLRSRFGILRSERTKDSCIIVVEVQMEGEPVILGILGDMVEEVLDLNPAEIEPPPKIGTQIRSDFILGMGKQGERFTILLDIDRIFSSAELALVQGTDED